MTWDDGLPRFVVPLSSDQYPTQLSMTNDPPKTLYVIGDPDALRPGLAVIGARKATPYGLSAARLFAGWAARSGYVVTSGCAIGCDQAAHLSALDAGGKTVAVLAGGADVAYPRAAHQLLRAIASSGAVVSEHPWGTQLRRWAFSTRNRIIAGLSATLLVTEAALPSGTFSTADYALAAGRDVLVVPGSIFSASSRGANRLLVQGATPVTDVSELAASLRAVLGEPNGASRPLDCDVPSSSAECAQDPLLTAVLADPMRPDDLARALGLDVVTVARSLGRLERVGRVARHADGRYGAP